MDDLNKEVDTSWDSPKLIKKTLDEMPFISISKKETPELTKKLCGNLQTLCGSFCEIRNNNPFLSHGTSITQENLDKNYAKLVVKSTEAIGGFLLSIHDKTLSGEKIKIAYEKNEDFNESFDESFDEKIKVGKEYEFFPSEILFNCDFEAYKQELSEYKLSKENLNKKEINSQN